MQIATDLLSHLRDGQSHTAGSLAKALQVSLASIKEGIDFLRSLGVLIKGSQQEGFRWDPLPGLLSKSQIEQHLSPWIKERISHIAIFPILGSTNSYLISQIPLGLEPGTVCLAETQTAGRGRLGRVWQSPFGTSLSLSLYWRFATSLQALSALSLVVGLMVLETLKTFAPLAPGIGIKWPNDILLEGAKLAGILLETGAKEEGAHREKGVPLVIGIGMNVDLPGSFSDPLRTDLRKALGTEISRNVLVARLLEKLIEGLTLFEKEGFQPFLSLWESMDWLAERDVLLTTPSGQQSGRVKGINQKGELLIEHEGVLKAYCYGEVSVRPEN